MTNFADKSKDKDSDESKDVKHDVPTATPSMEKAYEDLNNNSILNSQNQEHSLDDAIKKARENFAALTSMKDARAFTSIG